MNSNNSLLIPQSDKKFFSQRFYSIYSQLVDEDETGPSETNVTSTCRTGDYFNLVDQQNATFSHNAMILKQLELIKQQHEFYLVLDESFNLINMQDFSQLNNDQQFSVFLNVVFKGSSNINQSGLWIGRTSAILPDNSVVIFAQCVVPDKINDKSINLLTLCLLIADSVFFEGAQQENLNNFISHLRMVYHYADLLKEQTLFLSDQLQVVNKIQNKKPSSTQYKELQKNFPQIIKIRNFPANPGELDDLFFAQDINKYISSQQFPRFPIKIKQVFGQIIPLKLLQYLVSQAASDISRHMSQQDIMGIYSFAIFSLISDIEKDFLENHFQKCRLKLQSILPCHVSNFQKILEQNRLDLFEMFNQEVYFFKRHEVYHVLFQDLKMKIYNWEKQIFRLNRKLLEKDGFPFIEEVKDSIFGNWCFDSADPDLVDKFDVHVIKQKPQIFPFFFFKDFWNI